MDAVIRKQLKIKACKARMGIIEGVFNAKSGHPGGSLSCVDIVTYLYFQHMNIDPQNPKMEDRDRFVLSKGHAVPALYSVLAQRGFFPVEQLKTLRKSDSMLQGHPSMKYTAGVDMCTGSLGQGISTACGMALASKLDGKSNRVYTILGDGEIQEGQVWEAAMFASAKGLDNLVAVVDNNGLQIDGKISEVNTPYPIAEKFRAFGWNVIEIDGHDFGQIADALAKAREFSAEKAAARELKRTLPDVKAAFHAMSMNVQYPVTIQDEDLRMAFQSMEGVQDLIAKIVESVYNAASYDEYLILKYLIIKAVSSLKTFFSSFLL